MDDLNLNLVIIIVFLVIGAIRWVIENILGKKKPPQSESWEEYDYEERDYDKPQTNSIEDLYEEARREILDRQNRNVPQPEVIEQKLSEYRSPSSGPPPIPVPGKARINRPPPVEKAEPRRQLAPKKTVVTEEQKKAAAAFQQMGKKEQRASTRKASRVRELLASPEAARDAIVLAEILGKPKGAR